MGWAPVAVAAVLAWSAAVMPPAARAEEVTIKPGALTLNANLETADGAGPESPIVLITHGTLAHNGMEIIRAQQKLLAERGLSSLAINLSLGLDNRHGMYDCKVPHVHGQHDAADEIAAWVGWLVARGATDITVMGHSRGGTQMAAYAAGPTRHPAVKRAALMAPGTWDKAKVAAGYEKANGQPLQLVLDLAWQAVAAGRPGEMLHDTGILYCPGATVSAGSFVSYYQEDPRLSILTLIDDVPIPTLILAGTADTVVADLIPAMPAHLRDGVTLKVIDGADHFFLDFYGEDAADAVAAFVEDGGT
ncbi:MAG: alpha/beta fold hydrolase [Rhodobacterales bacterium]|nr:alpha/beta fold hydrolase [Rhodobacterales bacterium]